MKRTLALFLILLVTLPLFACGALVSTRESEEPPRPKEADYSGLSAAIASVPQDLSPYTKESAGHLNAALENVRYGLSEDKQVEVDRMEADIRAAIGALEEALSFSSLQEIIEYVDALGIDFDDLASFTMDGYFDSVLLPKTEDAGEEYFRNTYYLGDSITLYMHRFSNLPSDHIYGVGSINPQNAAEDKIVTLKDGTEATFAEAMREIAPERIVITIGTNSMLMDSLEYLTYFARLIEDLKAGCPDAEIILQSTSPLTAKYESGMKLLTNRNLNRSNLLLAGLAAYEHVHFLDSARYLKNEAGQLDEKYDLGEGYGHINRAAYDVWEHTLRTHAIEK